MDYLSPLCRHIAHVFRDRNFWREDFLQLASITFLSIGFKSFYLRSGVCLVPIGFDNLLFSGKKLMVPFDTRKMQELFEADGRGRDHR
jgi:hypothetical protein